MFNRSIAHNRRFALPRIARGAYALVAMVALCAVSPGRAHANLTITPTFDSSITNDPNAAAIEGTINSAIGVLESDISTPITVSVYFQATPEDVEFDVFSNTTTQFWASYYDYYNALKAIDTAPGATSAQRTAFASLGAAPSPTSGNPVTGWASDQSMMLTSANLRALGLPAPPPFEKASNGQLYDSIIDLDPTITYPPNPNTGSNYGLEATMLHELDEVLGIGGGGSQLSVSNAIYQTNGVGPNPAFQVGPMDLYRYSAPGVRSFSLYYTASPYSYFSIDGGNTVLSYFNQYGDATDYGDWLSDPFPAGYGPQVQDAIATPGANPTLGVNELTALNVIGYTLAVPEPASGTLLALGAAFLLRRRRSSITAE
ncbi:MAG: NF038122 family metalloprotease [Tepidisphaeraceae bacterium]